MTVRMPPSPDAKSHVPEPTQSPFSDQSTSSYLAFPVSHVVSTLYRRLTEPTKPPPPPLMDPYAHSMITPPLQRTASPYQPPPLTALTLRGIAASTASSAQILSRTLAEEIRLLVPPRLQLVTEWTLAYSVEQDGVSLATLYQKCAEYQGGHNGFVLVVRDGAGGIFGAFLTSPPHPAPHYYGTGECFLWRASILATTSSSILASLPAPPSADTTNLQRSTTLLARSATPPVRSPPPNDPRTNINHNHNHNHNHTPSPHTVKPIHNNLLHNPHPSRTGTPEPLRIRFKAFPYSGVNDYMMFCQADYLSVGGGDGRYGLWLDRVLERGISSHCLTFGNEGLSEEGEKFEVVGVEVWYLGT